MYILKIRLTIVLIAFAVLVACDENVSHNQDLERSLLDNIREFVFKNTICLHSWLKSTTNFEYPNDLGLFILLGITIRLVLQIFSSQPSFVYNKADNIDFSEINEQKLRETMGKIMKGSQPKNAASVEGINNSQGGVVLENIDQSLKSITNDLSQISSANDSFKDEIVEAHFKLFSTLQNVNLEN